MAGGWARDGAVEEQIEASISDELARLKAKTRPVGESLRDCAECGEPIPEARRAALPGGQAVHRVPERAGCAACDAGRDQPPGFEGQPAQVTLPGAARGGGGLC
jgi:hypothetical protein